MKAKFIYLSWILLLVMINIITIITISNYKVILQKDKLISLYEEKISEKDKKFEILYNRLTKMLTPDELLERDIDNFIKKYNPNLKKETRKLIAINVIYFSKKHQISPQIILGIMKVESTFNPYAIGKMTQYGRARGIMQVMPEWINKLPIIEKEEDLFDISKGMEAGILVLKIHLKECNGSLTKALYYYVNRDSSYSKKVYESIGKFTAFRASTNIDADNQLTSIMEEARGIYAKSESQL